MMALGIAEHAVKKWKTQRIQALQSTQPRIAQE
jgi:hypothetical protein